MFLTIRDRVQRVVRKLAFTILVCALPLSAFADTPTLNTAPPAQDFVGETFCFDAGFTNLGTTGYGPYYQFITKPDYDLASGDFIGLGLTVQSVGTFPASPGNQLTDPISGLDVTGPEGGELNVIRYPIGSVVTGQPSLEMTLCVDVDTAATIDVLESDAFEIVPAYEFGDTPTGTNGPTLGTRADFDFTPVVITYAISDILAEMENPPGPAWTWDIEVTADIAADRLVTPIDFATISPIVLPANVQFVGPVTFTGTGVSCTATTPTPPPPESPGGSVTLSCTSGTGTLGDDTDITATFPVYIVDTLDETTCGTTGAINEAKHVTIRKTSTGGGFPGASITYTIEFQVSEFVDGIDDLSIEDILPDGLTFVNSPTVTYNGGGATAITPTVLADTPATGQTTATYDVTGTTGVLLPATSGFITYTATIDQTYDGGALAGEPVRARDTLTNNVVGTYDITNGASACTDDSAESVTVPDVAASKGIITSTTVQPGDTVTYTLRLDIPSGDVQGIFFNDYFPLPVFDSGTVDTNTDISANTNIRHGVNHTLGVGFDAVAITAVPAENRLQIEWPDVVTTSSQTIEVEIDIDVSSEPFSDGLVLSNLFQAITNNSAVDGGTALQIQEITLQEPELMLTKTATGSTSGLEAGDTVTFDLVTDNTGGAEAYDIVVTDTAPAEFTSCSLDSVTGGSGAGDPFGAGYTFSSFSGVTGTALDPGDSVTLSVSCDIAQSAANNETLDNTAGVQWAAQPGATQFPIVEDTESVSTAQAQSFKEILTTSEAHTDDTTADTAGDPRPVATGEIVRYRTWFYVPQSTLTSVEIQDLLPTGLAYLADGTTLLGLVTDGGSALTASGLSCGSGTAGRAGNEATDLSTLGLDCVVTPTGGGASGADPRVILGTVTNTEDDGNEELIVLELNARVVGDAASDTIMNNRARFETDNGDVTSGGVRVIQTNPAILIDKTVIPTMADANDTVEYVVTVEADVANSSADAYDITFLDTLPSGITYDSGSGVTGPQPPTGGDTCTAAGANVTVTNPAGPGTTIQIDFDALPEGEICEIRYFATTNGTVVPGQQIVNTVDLDYDSLPGTGTDPNPTGSSPGVEAAFTGQAQATLTIDDVSIEKSIDATDYTHTSESTADTVGDPRPVAVGETLTYRLQMRLPEGNADNYVVTDFLPAGLQYQTGTARIAFVFDGGGSIAATPAVVCGSGTLNQTGDESTVAGIDPSCTLEPTGGPFGNGTDPVWDLGDLANTDMDADQEFIIIEFDARVLDVIGNQDGTVLSNTYEVDIDGATSTSIATVAEVVEPQLTLSSTTTPDPIDNRIDTTPAFSWDITLANAGNTTAFQIDSAGGSGWEIVLPVGVENIASLALTPTGNVYLNGTTTTVLVSDITLSTTNNTNDTLTFNSPLQMAAGASLLIEFDAELLASVLPGDSPTVTEEVVYVGHHTGNSAAGVRDDSDVGAGTGNSPITDTANLDDYRTEIALQVDTMAEAPSLAVSKAVTTGPTNNGDGTFDLTYTIALTNDGDVGLDNVAVADNLDTTFGVGNYTLTDVRVVSDSTTLTEDTNFTGAPATIDLLVAGSSTLPVGESGTIEIDLTVTPGAMLGPVTNTAVGTSTSDRTGTAADDDGAGDVTFVEDAEIGIAKRVSAGPTNNMDGSYTLSYEFFVENSGSINLDGVQVTDDLSVAFAGATGFTVDSLTSGDFAVNFPGYDGQTAGDTNLLTGADTLSVGATGTIVMTVTVTPGASLGPYNNSANAQADPPSDNTVTDTSDDGADPDGNGNGDPTDDSDVTPITFSENPEIGTAKSIAVGPTNNMDGTYTLTYQILLENSGDVPLENLQITDNLTATFAAATTFTVDTVTSSDFTPNFPGFNGVADTSLLVGTDTLAFGATGTLDLTVTVTPGTTLGPYNNQATGSGDGPGGTTTTDVSDSGTDPDGNGNGDPTDDTDPTPVTFTEMGEVGLAKAVAAGSPTVNGDGTFTVVYDLVVENSGDVPIMSIQVIEDLDTTFAAASSYVVDNVTSADFSVNFPGFNGSADTNLLDGTDGLATSASGSIALTVTVTPGANLGPYNNTADVNATTAGGSLLTDTSDNGTDPDGNGNGDPADDLDPTPITFVENPEIGLAKDIAGAVSNNGDGSYSLTYTFAVENSGDTPLNDVQINDDLATTFAAATGFTVDAMSSADFTVNFPGFNGIGDQDLLLPGNTLASSTTGTVTVTVTVTPGTTLGPYLNTADVDANSPGGMAVFDTSDFGTDPDGNSNGDPSDDSDVTPVTFVENPEIGLAKDIASGPVNNLDGSYTLTYRFYVENSGDVPVSALQITDDLATVYAAATSFSVDGVASADFAVNFPGFDGVADQDILDGTDTLATGASGTVDVSVTVTPGATLGPYDNTADANATSVGGSPVTDTSHTGTDPDGNGNSDPSDDVTPTTVTFVEGPAVTVSKAVLTPAANNNDGTYTLTYRVTVANAGDTPLNSVQVTDDLEIAFTAASAFNIDSVNSTTLTTNVPGYDGLTAGDTNLLAGSDSLATGASGDIDITLTVTPGITLGPYTNIANGDGTSPGGTNVSDSGSAPAVSFAETPEIGLAKNLVAGPTNNGDGTYSLSYSLLVENSGDVPLTNVQINDDLTTTFALANSYVVDSVSPSAGLTINPNFNIAGDTALLTGADSLAVSASETVVIVVTVTPGAILGPYSNTATASGDSPAASTVVDTSTDGVNPDGDGNGDPTDDSVPTQVTFSESPEIGLAKAIVAGPTNNGDGTYTLTYRFTAENSGDVLLTALQVTDDLATVFAGATTYVVDAMTSADLTVNYPGYNGDTNQDLLTGTDTLAVGVISTVDMTVTVTPGATLGPYQNTALADANSPTGTGVSDTSDAGLDPDGNGNGDPGDDGDTTDVTFTEAPEIGLAKAVVGSPVNNSDGTYTLDYLFTLENSGDVAISGVQIVDDLATTFTGAVGFTVDSITSTDFTANFPGFNGAADQNILTGVDSLAVGVTGTVTVRVTVTPGVNLGPYNNTATANGTSPTGAGVIDVSDAGIDPDGNGDGDPTNDGDDTPVTFSEMPQIGLAKSVLGAVVNNTDGTYTFTYQFLLENTGDVALSGVQVTDDLATVFVGATAYSVDSIVSSDFTVNNSFDGIDLNLLSGTDSLAVGVSGIINVVVTVTPGSNLGPYQNSADVVGTSPSGVEANDTSDDAGTVDENGNGDPTDDSDTTDVTFSEAPVIGLAKSLVTGPTNNGDGSYTLGYQFTLENLGDVALRNVQIVDDLSAVFAAASSFTVDSLISSDFSIASTFDGLGNNEMLTATDILAVGASGVVDLVVTVTPGAALGPYQNTAMGTGMSPGGTTATDDSVDGLDPDPDANGDPSDNTSPTDVSFSENALIGIAKAAALGTPNFDGTFTTTITLIVENRGDVEIRNVLIADDIATNIAPATVTSIANVAITGSLAALDPAFDGVANIALTDGSESLAVGEIAQISFDLTFNGEGNLGPFANTATAAGESPGNPTPGVPNISDESTDGTNPDADGNGDPTDDSTPTDIEFTPGADGAVDITDESVPGDTLDVTVTDADENMDPTVIERFDVTVRNDQTGELEIITLTETGADTGIFVGTVPTIFAETAGPDDDGTLVTRPEDTVTVLYDDRLTSQGDVQTRTDTGVVIGFATIEGNAWLDADTDDVFDAGETPLEGWIIRVERDGVLITEVPVNPDGSYSVAELLPGPGYSVSLLHPDSGVTFGMLTGLDLPPETVVLDQNMPIDPSGVFYNSVDRTPVEGVIATLVNSSGTPLPDACLFAGQQDQTTVADGFYRFDVLADQDPACASGETYTIVFQVPADFNPGISALLPPLPGPLDPTGLGDPLRVAPNSGAPQLADSTDYYLTLTLETGDPDVVFNHIPLDPIGVGGFTVRLTKDVNQPTTSIGGLVSYTITIENLSTVLLPGLSVVDSLPPGFSYVENSARIDDGSDPLMVTGARPVTFGGIALAAGERRVLRYVLRAGVGLTRGEYVNTASPFVGPAPIGNSDTARVIVVADPDFEETTVIGKVWNDRDEDGWQDLSAATDVRIDLQLVEPQQANRTLVQVGDKSAKARRVPLAQGVKLGELPGRYGDADQSNENVITLRDRFSQPFQVEALRVTTDEGTVINLDDEAQVSVDHRGKKRAGLTSQDLQVSYAVHALKDGYELTVRIENLGMDEPGIPGVRLATVEGLLIETDAYGRYHVAAVDGGFNERGRNYIVKVDKETLPKGTSFTTENPRVKRISQGLMNRFDFGVHLPESAPLEQRFNVKIAEMFFVPGSATVEPAYLPALAELVEKLKQGAFVSLSVEAYLDPAETDESAARVLAKARGQALVNKLCELAGVDLSANIKVKQLVTVRPAAAGSTR